MHYSSTYLKCLLRQNELYNILSRFCTAVLALQQRMISKWLSLASALKSVGFSHCWTTQLFWENLKMQREAKDVSCNSSAPPESRSCSPAGGDLWAQAGETFPTAGMWSGAPERQTTAQQTQKRTVLFSSVVYRGCISTIALLWALADFSWEWARGSVACKISGCSQAIEIMQKV